MKRSKNMIYSPREHIPIGEYVEKDGEPMLRVKKQNTDVYEDVPIGTLLNGIYGKGALQEVQARRPQKQKTG